jgi:hypothetical protein
VDLALRVALGVVMAWAAGAKMVGARAFSASLAAHGVPRGLRPAAAAGVIGAEAVLGALLLAGVLVPWAAVAAALLGLLFAGVLVRARLRGARRSACACFGGHRERGTLALAGRALALAALAGVTAAAAAGHGAPSGDVLVPAAIALLALAVVVLGVLVLALYRQVGVLTQRLGPRAALELAEEGPPLGAPPPPLAGLRRAGPELVAFMSAGCRLCGEVQPGLRALAREGLAVRTVDEAADRDVFARWTVPGTPFVVYVVDGVVAAKGLVNSLEQIDGLIAVGGDRRRAAA